MFDSKYILQLNDNLIQFLQEKAGIFIQCGFYKCECWIVS